MTAQAAKQVVDEVINMKGVVRVSSVTQEGGKIILSGGAKGKVNVNGTLEATGTKGGKVTVTGQNIELGSDTKIDASGVNGGGEIRVGGDYQGTGDLQRSDATYVAAGAEIKNDALENGDGGETIFWSDGVTAFEGNATAKGGALGGDGGLIEISGVNGLVYQGSVDTTAAFGETGTLLFDPRDIDFRVGTRGGDTTDGLALILSYLDGDIDYTDGTNFGNFRIYESDIEGITTADVILRARRNFTVNNNTFGASDGVINIANGNDLLIETLNETGSILGVPYTNQGSINLTGNSSYGANLEWRTTGAGTITINAATANDSAATGDIVLSKLTTAGGAVNIDTNNGSITWAGAVSTSGGAVNGTSTVNNTVNAAISSGNGAITLTNTTANNDDEIPKYHS
jgi:hypothetical protein